MYPIRQVVSVYYWYGGDGFYRRDVKDSAAECGGREIAVAAALVLALRDDAFEKPMRRGQARPMHAHVGRKDRSSSD